MKSELSLARIEESIAAGFIYPDNDNPHLTKTKTYAATYKGKAVRVTIPEPDIGDDLVITKSEPRTSAGGSWVCGTILGHRFDALVFPEHAENPDYEIRDSRISKLWVQRLADKKTVYNWDRGLDIPAANTTAQAIVDFLCAGLAEHTYAK